ncbi:FliO/MopB family protein [Nocardioides yefusunii]|uniref:FliO/MopB family protein n=1 Tax=Nocardioides yefusunii TaxID=2500546 RepID=A0ABW1QZ33_9ACTN|nr:flagellar biosynthetic protein FliO [Nocardioides yefusunii]
MFELTLRLVFSLAVVIGLLLIALRITGKRMAGGADALVRVVHRQPLGRSSSVAVVTVGSRVLVLGTTEQQVTLLTELDPEEIVSSETVDEAMASDGTSPGGLAPGVHLGKGGPLAGSLLSADTWKQTWSAVSAKGRQR